MGRSKKGRLSGTARKEINFTASSEAVAEAGTNAEIAFARVTRMMGMGHVNVLIPTSHGTRELTARIPNKFGKRGATPITINSVVSIFVGSEFDPNVKTRSTEHFDITSILSDKQTYELFKRGCVPEWMLKSPDEVASGVVHEEETGEGFEFDHSGLHRDSDEEGEGEEGKEKEKEKVDKVKTPVYMLKGTAAPARKFDDDLNIDDI